MAAEGPAAAARGRARGGYLRTGVRVERHGSTVTLAHSFWALDLPASWVESVPGLAAVLERRGSIHDLPAGGPELRDLLLLLDAHGCLSYPERQSYSLREMGELFSHLSAAWYAAYNAHPLWDGLRHGTLSTNGLVAWLLQNYHLSRSVGMSASRSAIRLDRPALRVLFARSALEEYWHCEDFFFVRHPSLPVTDREVRRAVPLPSSVGFDQQMLRMAEDDWLGHVLTALFQETTARFHHEVRDFYRTVSANYGLAGFFGSWERHIEIDLEEDHADDFSAVLESDERRSREQVLASLHGAWLTFRCLLSSLDDVVAADRDDGRVALRLPVQDGRLDPDATALLEPFRGVLGPSGRRLRARSGADLSERVGALCLERGGSRTRAGRGRLPGEDVTFLRADVAASIFRCMSFATGHEEVLLLGRLAEGASSLVPGGEAVVAGGLRPRSHHAMALANFLRELATRPVAFVLALRHATRVAEDDGGGWLAVDGRMAARMDAFLAGAELEPRAADAAATRLLQLDELLERWVSLAGLEGPVDLLRD